MPLRPLLALLATGLLVSVPAHAQPAPAAPAASAPKANERRVIEDDQVRIEETMVRGQVQSVSVTPKQPGARPYEIAVGRGGRDPSQDKSAAGQRVWSLFRF